MRYLIISLFTAALLLASCGGGSAGSFCAFGICTLPDTSDVDDITADNYTHQHTAPAQVAPSGSSVPPAAAPIAGATSSETE